MNTVKDKARYEETKPNKISFSEMDTRIAKLTHIDGEFIIWFKGFADALEGPPNEQQWNRVLQRLKKCYE